MIDPPTPNDSSTARVVADYLQRLADRDADAIAGLFAEEIDWYVAGNRDLPWTGARTRRSEVADFFCTMWPHFETGKSTSTLEKLVISGEDAVLFATFTHTAVSTGRAFRTPVAMHLTVTNGKIGTMHLYEDTLAVSAAFLA